MTSIDEAIIIDETFTKPKREGVEEEKEESPRKLIKLGEKSPLCKLIDAVSPEVAKGGAAALLAGAGYFTSKSASLMSSSWVAPAPASASGAAPAAPAASAPGAAPAMAAPASW